LILIAPSGSLLLLQPGGSQGLTMVVSRLVVSFGIGATLTGAVFIMMEEP
jgi:hypothetical protein